jgi:hypothetical protein
MEQEELALRLEAISEEYEKDIPTVTDIFAKKLEEVEKNTKSKNKPLLKKVLRALRLTDLYFIDEATSFGKEQDIYVLGFLRPKDRNAGSYDLIVKEYLDNPSSGPQMVQEGKIKGILLQDETGSTVVKEELDDSGLPIPLDTDPDSKTKGQPITARWYSALIGLPINPNNELGELIFYWISGDKADPTSPKFILSHKIVMNRITAKVYKSESGGYNIDRSDITIFEATNEEREEAAEYTLESTVLESHVTPLTKLQSWIDVSEKYVSPKNGTSYVNPVCITTGMVKSVFARTSTSSANLKIIDYSMIPELKRRGYTVWLPEELESTPVGSSDDVIIIGKVSQKTTIYDRDARQNVAAPEGKGDINITALGIFPIWGSDDDNGKPSTPSDITEGSVQSEIASPKTFSRSMI